MLQRRPDIAADEAAGKYRGQVLAAFEQVENNQSIIDGLGSALDDQRAAAAAARFTEYLSMRRYKHGAVGYLDVVVAQKLRCKPNAVCSSCRRECWPDQGVGGRVGGSGVGGEVMG